MIKNYNLFNKFNKYLAKISSATVDRFGSKENVILFLQALSSSASMVYAAKAVTIPVMQLPRIINCDRHLSRCVELSLQLAIDKAESVLYDRAINGYEELTYNKDGECVSRKKKYCSKSLLEYLKANSIKYNTKKDINSKVKGAKPVAVTSFEVESYDSGCGK